MQGVGFIEYTTQFSMWESSNLLRNLPKCAPILGTPAEQARLGNNKPPSSVASQEQLETQLKHRFLPGLVKSIKREAGNLQGKAKYIYWRYHRHSFVGRLVLNSPTITEQRANRNDYSLSVAADRLSDLCRINVFALGDFWHIDLESWNPLTASFKMTLSACVPMGPRSSRRSSALGGLLLPL